MEECSLKSRLSTMICQHLDRISQWYVGSGLFEVKVGVKQDCVLSPVIFNLAAVTLLSHNVINTADGITGT